MWKGNVSYLQFIYKIFAVGRDLTTGLLQFTPVYLHGEVFVDHNCNTTAIS